MTSCYECDQMLPIWDSLVRSVSQKPMAPKPSHTRWSEQIIFTFHCLIGMDIDAIGAFAYSLVSQISQVSQEPMATRPAS